MEDPKVKKRTLNLYLPEELIRFTKMYAASKNMNISKLVEEAIIRYLPDEVVLKPNGGSEIS